MVVREFLISKEFDYSFIWYVVLYNLVLLYTLSSRQLIWIENIVSHLCFCRCCSGYCIWHSLTRLSDFEFSIYRVIRFSWQCPFMMPFGTWKFLYFGKLISYFTRFLVNLCSLNYEAKKLAMVGMNLKNSWNDTIGFKHMIMDFFFLLKQMW